MAKDDFPKLPQSASPTYKALFLRAVEFIDTMQRDADLPDLMDFDRLRACTAPDYMHDWGHNYAVSHLPKLQGKYNWAQFHQHFQMMLPRMERADTTITDINVDEHQMKVTLRVSLVVQAKGTTNEEAVENDMLWFLEMVEEGEEVKIRRSTEFLDMMAMKRFGDLMAEKSGMKIQG
jgi:ketosteroid isomerase-like protein